MVTLECVEKLIHKDMIDPVSGDKLKEKDIIVLQRVRVCVHASETISYQSECISKTCTTVRAAGPEYIFMCINGVCVCVSGWDRIRWFWS